MFALKGDFARNKMICLCDVVTNNGYALEGLSADLKKQLESKATIQLQQ